MIWLLLVIATCACIFGLALWLARRKDALILERHSPVRKPGGKTNEPHDVGLSLYLPGLASCGNPVQCITLSCATGICSDTTQCDSGTLSLVEIDQ